MFQKDCLKGFLEDGGENKHKHKFVIITCPECGRKFKVSRKKKGVNTRGAYKVVKHKNNSIYCQGKNMKVTW